jgi:hypothetical protein
MAHAHSDDLHTHATWGPLLRPEGAEPGRLHRHRISDPYSVPRFTSWEHNGPAHSHRLPDGAWTRPRTDLRPPRDEATAATEPPQLRIRRPPPPSQQHSA